MLEHYCSLYKENSFQMHYCLLLLLFLFWKLYCILVDRLYPFLSCELLDQLN